LEPVEKDYRLQKIKLLLLQFILPKSRVLPNEMPHIKTYMKNVDFYFLI